MRRVLVPTDFSETGLLVTTETLTWAEAMDGEIILLHVVRDIFIRWLDHLSITFVDHTRLASAYEDLRADGLRRFSAWLPPPAKARCRTHVIVGDTADAILKVAQEEVVDVIVMRAPRRRWWRPILAGSVTETVMRRASVPVIVWAGLDHMSASACWRGARQPLDDAAPQWERMPSLNSW